MSPAFVRLALLVVASTLGVDEMRKRAKARGASRREARATRNALPKDACGRDS